MIMEAKKSHGLLCARWKPRETGGIIQSESGGLMTRGANVWITVKSESPRTKRTDVQGQLKQREQTHSLNVSVPQ